jgi:hypothetical protein
MMRLILKQNLDTLLQPSWLLLCIIWTPSIQLMNGNSKK